MLSRRDFLSVLTVASASVLATRARADEIVDGEEAHPIEPPAALEFKTMSWATTPFYGGPSTAIAAVPKDLAPGQRLPLVELLPGGHHNMQRHDKGAWGWWSEYRLGEIDAALRRGKLTEDDFRKLTRPRDLEWFNLMLATTPYRGAVFVTPWVVGRQLEPAPHGTMVAEFLRDLVERAREELPVLPSREATGLGGMSSGGLWTLFSGAMCSDLFGTLVATQPFTEDLVKPLRAAVNARAMPQRLRMVTSDYDHQRASTVELSEALHADGIAHDLIEYVGPHSAGFAAGPGGLDAMLVFDRALRGEALDGTRPLPSHDGLAAPITIGDLPPRASVAPQKTASIGPPMSPTWPLAGIGVVTAAAAVALRTRRLKD
ncbi:MAG: hypothetical protein ACXWUG_18360 [Polyangiales bacterium]